MAKLTSIPSGFSLGQSVSYGPQLSEIGYFKTNVGGTEYYFLPSDLIQQGVIARGNFGRDAPRTYFLPKALSSAFQNELKNNGSYADLSSVPNVQGGGTYGEYLNAIGRSTKGYFVPVNNVTRDVVENAQTTNVGPGNTSGIKGIINSDRGLAYSTVDTQGHDIAFTDSTGHSYVYDAAKRSGGLLGIAEDIAGGVQSIAQELGPILPIVIAFAAPGVGSAIALELGVPEAVGVAIASTAMQTAAGVPFDKALENAVTAAVVQTGSSSVAKDINAAMSNLPPDTAAAISNAAGSALSSAAITAARGGSTQDIINNAVAGAAGSAASSATDSTAVGGAVTGGLTGGATGAALGAAGALGREAATTSTPTTTPSDTQAVIPQGVQVAGELSPETFSVEVGGTPIYADTPQAASYTAPFGYRLMTMAEADAKPEGAFYDPTTNAWLVPDTAAVTGLAESITAPLEPVTTPTTAPISITSGADVGIATPQDTGTPTGPAPQGILIPDQITQVSGGSAGDGGVVGGEGAPSTDQQIMDLTGITAPEAIPTPENIPVLPEVVVTPSPEEPDLQVADATEEPPPEEEPPPKETPPKEVAPEPYKPQFFVAGGVSPRMQSRAPSSALADALQTPFERSLITSGLTSYRGAGEIESPESGGKRRNVWNEASLRLKDALGI